MPVLRYAPRSLQVGILLAALLRAGLYKNESLFYHLHRVILGRRLCGSGAYGGRPWLVHGMKSLQCPLRLIAHRIQGY